MSITEERTNVDTGREIEISAESRLQDLTARFSSRGLSRSVEKDAEAQILREKETQSFEPSSYRLSTLSDSYVSEKYRHGKELMSEGDLLEYFAETRAQRTQDTDFSQTLPEDELVKSGDAERECVLPVRGTGEVQLRKKIASLPRKIKTLPRETKERVKLSYPLWFNGAKPDTSRETRRFPLSAFAAILVVAMSLMLVVASSVLVNHAEGRFNTLKIEASELSAEIADMEADLAVQNDLLALREVAVNELGMVDEDFVRMEYVSNDTENSIVILDEEEEKTVGLSAILNALGIQ